MSEVEARTFAVNYSATPDPESLLAVDMTILDPTARVDLRIGQGMGRRYLAYLSIVEINRQAAHFEATKRASVRIFPGQNEWQSQLVDVASPKWESLVIEKLARPAIQRGFDGFFIDTADSLATLSARFPEKKSALRRAVLNILHRLHQEFPGREIMINRGFDLLPDLKGVIDSVLIESVFRTYDAAGKYVSTTPETRAALTARVRSLQRDALPVYVLDYLPPGDTALADQTLAEIRALGAEPFLSTRELQGVMLGPVREMPRRILVLYGHVLAESESAQGFAADSFVAERLQMPLEWMGYEVDYVDIGKMSPPLVLDGRFCGIILDAHLQLPFAGEEWYVDWLVAHQQRGVKLLFCGAYPFQQDIQRARLLTSLGCTGSFSQVHAPQDVSLRMIDRTLMDFEAKMSLHSAEVEDTRAPSSAAVHLSVQSRDAAANALQYDAVYTGRWGGAVLDPYATFQASADDQASLFDPFKLLHLIWPVGRFPAPDTSTRDGCRIFYSHIDGDGFNSLTHYSGKQICAEIVRERILKKYPFPVTVSLIEATMRGLEVGQDEGEKQKLEDVARDIFKLPNVQVGSHSYSHPYVWIDNDDEYIPQYETRALVLKRGQNAKTIDPEREVAGSIAYINGLCPRGKQVEIMLWSGNCRPSPEAIRICRKVGVENLNGGGATISARHPFMANIEPRVMQWDGELQIYASHQNEFVYTKNWRGPFYGGFTQVLESFKLTESPRRLKPVNIYYHFYSSATSGALRALEQVHEWSLHQPLHAVTAREFAALTRDSWKTRIYEAGEHRYLMVNAGLQRTFRMPATTLVPDMAASSGLAGWVKTGEQLFLHTKGSPCTTLQLTARTGVHLFLESSQGHVAWQSHRHDAATMDIACLLPDHQFIMGGMPPRSFWQVTVNDKVSVMEADANGRLDLLLHGNTRIALTAQPPAKAP